jgi:hypothetical protein
MATNQYSNRINLFNIIRKEFISSKTNKQLTFDEWFDLFFKNANNLSDAGSTSDENGVKYNNLFNIINFKKSKYDKNLTIFKYYFDPKVQNSAGWIKKLTNKEEFYKSFACDLPWASGLDFCKGNTPPPTESINLDDKVGIYTTDNSIVKKIKITKVSDYYLLTSSDFNKIPKINEFAVCKLVPPSDGSSIYGISSTMMDSTLENVITLTSDGFVFDYKDPLTKKFSLIKFKATKVSGGTTDLVTTPNPDEKKKPTPAEKEKEEIPVVRTNTLHFNNDKKTYVATKKCDDFPFTLGCSNKLIGDLNASLFNGDRMNDVYNDELQNLLDNGGNFGINSNKEITKKIYDKIMDRLMNERIIKETVKKVLKEYIIKK